jgi:DNA-binding response OmpR family regulator
MEPGRYVDQKHGRAAAGADWDFADEWGRKKREWKPDLILLDVMLPDESGFNLLAKLKAEESSKDIPIAMLTARDSREDVAKGSELGAIGYLVKYSTMPKVLLDKVKGWIG